MTRSRGALAAVILLALLIAALAYLRDPPWLIDVTSGLRRWETAADGTRYRWAGSHASFFVPADARSIALPVRTTFDTPSEWPITVEIAIDDRPAERFTLRDEQWRTVELSLPPPGSRRVRRIDLRLDRTRHDNHGVMLGEVVVTR